MMKNINKATNTNATASGFHIQLAKIYTAEKKFDQAIVEVDAAEKANSNDISLGYLKAQIWDAAHDPVRAAAARQAARDTIHGELAKEAKNSKENIFSDLTYPEAALFMETDPHDPGPFDGSHEAILLLGPLDGTVKLKPMDKLILGLAYCDKHDNKECRRLCQESMRDNPKFNTAKAHHNLGDSLRQGGDLEGSAFEYRTAYEMDPRNTMYRNDYEASRKH